MKGSDRFDIIYNITYYSCNCTWSSYTYCWNGRCGWNNSICGTYNLCSVISYVIQINFQKKKVGARMGSYFCLREIYIFLYEGVIKMTVLTGLMLVLTYVIVDMAEKEDKRR